MTESEKTQTIDKVRALLDANDRIRVAEPKSVQVRVRGQQDVEISAGQPRYLLIAVGEETHAEKTAVLVLSSAIVSR